VPIRRRGARPGGRGGRGISHLAADPIPDEHLGAAEDGRLGRVGRDAIEQLTAAVDGVQLAVARVDAVAAQAAFEQV
jgi:hypothetical protein